MRRDSEDGFTTIELLLASVLMIVVIGIPLTVGFKVFASQTSGGAVSTGVTNLENAMKLMLNDARSSYQSCTSTPSPTTVATGSLPASATMTFWVPIRGSASNAYCTSPTQQVTWTCTVGGTCTRQAGAGTPVTWVRQVTSVAVTATSATGATTLPMNNPSRLTVTLGARAVKDNGTVLSDGVPLVVSDSTTLRNFAG